MSSRLNSIISRERAREIAQSQKNLVADQEELARTLARKRAEERLATKEADKSASVVAITEGFGDIVSETGSEVLTSKGVLVRFHNDMIIVDVNGRQGVFRKGDVHLIDYRTPNSGVPVIEFSTVRTVREFISNCLEVQDIEEMHRLSPNSGWVYSASSFIYDFYRFSSMKEAVEKARTFGVRFGVNN